MTTTSGPAEQQPTARQLAYLKALAQRTGQSFTWPTTRAAASSEIRRLKAAAPTNQVEREIERPDWWPTDEEVRAALRPEAAVRRQ